MGRGRRKKSSEKKQVEVVEEEQEEFLVEEKHEEGTENDVGTDNAVDDLSSSSEVEDDEEEEAASSEEEEAASSEDEEEESGSSEEEQEMEDDPTIAANRKTHNKFNKPPSREELNHLRKTEDLFKSNLLKLEITELLKEAVVNYESSSIKSLNQVLHAFKNILVEMQCKSVSSTSFTKSKGIQFVKWDVKKANQDIKLQFEAPKVVQVVGSYLIHTMHKQKNKSVDISVEIPSGVFHTKDYLNYRYFDKRLLYIATIMQELQKYNQIFQSVSFETYYGDAHKPIIKLKLAKQTNCSNYSIYVFFTISQECFPLRRFMPKVSNVRLRNQQVEAQSINSPHYNMKILEDIESSTHKAHLELLHVAINSCQEMKECLILIKIWLKLRNLSRQDAFDNFNHFIVSMLMVHLLKTGYLSRYMSSQQMFKSMMHYFAETDMTAASGYIIRIHANKKEAQIVSDSDFLSSYDCCIIAPCGRLNVASRVSTEALSELRRQAAMSLDHLQYNSPGGRDNFHAIFTINHEYWHCFDEYIYIKLPQVNTLVDEESLCDLSQHEFIAFKASRLVNDGVVRTNRATNYRTFVYNAERKCQWTLDENVPSLEYMIVALHINHAGCTKVDKGPAADDIAAANTFRQLWGEKAELRRFRDGSIVETVVWEKCENVNQIPLRAIEYLFSIHSPFNIVQEDDAVRAVGSCVGEMLDKHISNHPDVLHRMYKKVSYQSSSSKLQVAFTNLSKQLRRLELPLSIASIEGSSAYLRQASPLHAVRHPLACIDSKERDEAMQQFNAFVDKSSAKKRKRVSNEMTCLLPTMDLVVEFESSGRWPDDFEAIQHMKTAFCINIAEELEKSELLCRCVAGRSSLNILMNGFAFQISIRVPRQLELLRNATSLNAIGRVASISGHSEQQNLMVWNELNLKLVRLPLLHSELHALYTKEKQDENNQKQSISTSKVLSPIVRLVKLWFHQHLLFSHIREEAIELLVASLFLHSKPYSPPQSIFSGFIRFLYLLGTWDWANQPLIVDVNNQLSADDYSHAIDCFNLRRDKGMNTTPMCILTPFDKNSSRFDSSTVSQDVSTSSWQPFWTSAELPSLSALNRMVNLAKDSLKLIEYCCELDIALLVNGNQKALWNAAFKSNYKESGYDLLIHLQSNHMLQYNRNESDSKKPKKSFNVSAFKNLMTQAAEKVLIGFSPVKLYVDELSKHFGHIAEFFSDELNCSVIAVRWKDGVLNPVPFRVAISNYSQPVDESKNNFSSIKLNAPEIIDAFHVLGNGIVRRIEFLENDD